VKERYPVWSPETFKVERIDESHGQDFYYVNGRDRPMLQARNIARPLTAGLSDIIIPFQNSFYFVLCQFLESVYQPFGFWWLHPKTTVINQVHDHLLLLDIIFFFWIPKWGL
jgi:hypothetical protein